MAFQLRRIRRCGGGGGGGGGDTIINVTVDPSKGHARDQIEEVAFQMRRLKRGGGGRRF
jgi:hypothetical protein